MGGRPYRKIAVPKSDAPRGMGAVWCVIDASTECVNMYRCPSEGGIEYAFRYHVFGRFVGGVGVFSSWSAEVHV